MDVYVITKQEINKKNRYKNKKRNKIIKKKKKQNLT